MFGCSPIIVWARVFGDMFLSYIDSMDGEDPSSLGCYALSVNTQGQAVQGLVDPGHVAQYHCENFITPVLLILIWDRYNGACPILAGDKTSERRTRLLQASNELTIGRPTINASTNIRT